MASSTVIRVKRRLEDNPQDALVLMCKRLKVDNEEVSPSLFVFRVSVDDQERTNVKNLFPKSDRKLQLAPDVKDIIEKIRKEHREESSKNRYKVVNCSRGLKDTTDKNNANLYNLVDLQKAEDIEKDARYMYDLYTAAKQDFDISMIDNLISIEHYETDLITGSYRDNGLTSSGDEADDDDDSNDENNWRNDYPDSEPSSIDEEDMIRAMERVDIEDNLSSDTGEDRIYDDPPDLFKEDVQRYGESYAKYKAKVLKEQSEGSGLIHSVKVKDLDEESIEGYKDDSDEGFYYGQDEDSQHFKDQYKSSDSDEYSPD